MWFRQFADRRFLAKMGYTSDAGALRDDEAEWFIAIENEIREVGERIAEHERKLKGGKTNLRV